MIKEFTGSFKINGYTDSHNQCDRCGKSELKGTYHITTESGHDYHIGSSCIKSAWQISAKDFERQWFAPYKTRLSLARNEFYKIVIDKQPRDVIDYERGAIAIKYGIKNKYEL